LKVTVDVGRNPVPKMFTDCCGVVPAVIEDGDKDVIAGTGLFAAETVTNAGPDLVESCVEVAVMVAVPAADGVNTPADVIVPFVADQVTAEL
jgi:hypothetical protein